MQHIITKGKGISLFPNVDRTISSPLLKSGLSEKYSSKKAVSRPFRFPPAIVETT